MSRTTRSWSPLIASSRPLTPSPATVVARCPSARRPLATNAAIRVSSSTIRIRAIGPPFRVARRAGTRADEPAGRAGSGSGCPTPAAARAAPAPDRITNRAPPRTSSSTRRRRGHGDRADDREAEPEALVVVGLRRCGRTVRRSGSRSSSGTPGPVSRTQQPHRAAVVRRPDGDLSPGRVCLTALSASWSSAWVIRCSSSTSMPRRDPVAGPSPRSPRPRALASTASVRAARSTGRDPQEVGPVALGEQDQVADQPRHPVDLVEQQLAGLVDVLGVAVSSSSRWPRSTVSGVLQLVAGVVEELALAGEAATRAGRACR